LENENGSKGTHIDEFSIRKQQQQQHFHLTHPIYSIPMSDQITLF